MPLGFLVVTPYNSCIFINASFLSPTIELSKNLIENVVYEEPGVCREREQRQEQVAAGTYGVRVVVSWRCGWYGWSPGTLFVENLKHNKTD